MSYGFDHDSEMEQSTNKAMLWGAGLMLAMVLVFPFYRWFEPTARQEAAELHIQSLAEQGMQIYELNCSSCHGADGEGGLGPALNSQQFLQASTDEQTRLLISVGVPGSQMSAYSLDFGGPLTLEQIKAVTTFMRFWEPDAPDRPNWRQPQGG